MKQLFGIVSMATTVAMSVALADDGKVIRLSDPVSTTATHEVFGAPWEAQDDATTLTEMLAHPERYLGQEVVVETRIAKVCQKKGCFFVATDGAASARVSFKDYGFFIPTDASGKQVSLIGIFSRKELSAEQAAHYAADLGERPDADTQKRFEYSIVASSVSIPLDG